MQNECDQFKTLFLVSLQEFKAFVLCLAFFVVTASGATVCKCGEEEKKVKWFSICSLLIHQIHALFFARFCPLTKATKRRGNCIRFMLASNKFKNFCLINIQKSYTKQYFPVVLFFVLYKVVLTFESFLHCLSHAFVHLPRQ